MESTRSITAYERFMNMVKLWIEKSYKGVDQVSRYLRWKRPKTKSLCFARASGLTQAARIYKNVLKRGTKALQNRTHPGTQKWSQNDANMDPVRWGTPLPRGDCGVFQMDPTFLKCFEGPADPPRGDDSAPRRPRMQPRGSQTPPRRSTQRRTETTLRRFRDVSKNRF